MFILSNIVDQDDFEVLDYVKALHEVMKYYWHNISIQMIESIVFRFFLDLFYKGEEEEILELIDLNWINLFRLSFDIKKWNALEIKAESK